MVEGGEKNKRVKRGGGDSGGSSVVSELLKNISFKSRKKAKDKKKNKRDVMGKGKGEIVRLTLQSRRQTRRTNPKKDNTQKSLRRGGGGGGQKS